MIFVCKPSAQKLDLVLFGPQTLLFRYIRLHQEYVNRWKINLFCSTICIKKTVFWSNYVFYCQKQSWENLQPFTFANLLDSTVGFFFTQLPLIYIVFRVISTEAAFVYTNWDGNSSLLCKCACCKLFIFRSFMQLSNTCCFGPHLLQMNEACFVHFWAETYGHWQNLPVLTLVPCLYTVSFCTKRNPFWITFTKLTYLPYTVYIYICQKRSL